VVTGIAGTYRILITDTLLETFSPEEIEAVVAHELGHQAKHHTTTRLLFLGGIYLLPLWIANLVLGSLVSDLPNFAYLPYLFIAFRVASLYMIIFFGLFARTQEEAADRFSWELTGNVSAFVSMLRKMAEQNLMVTQKRVATSHPAIENRIAAAENFLKQQAVAASAGNAG
jgi:Zn-dependent protease with chaperone function